MIKIIELGVADRVAHLITTRARYADVYRAAA